MSETLPYLLRRAGRRALLGLRAVVAILLLPVVGPLLLLGGARYRRDLANLARELDLAPVDESERVFSGTSGKYTVILRPFDRATVIVLFATRIPLMLAYEDRSALSSNQRRLDTMSFRLQHRFDTRFVEEGTLARYGDGIKPLWDRIAIFDDDRMWVLGDLAVEREGLVARMRHYPGFPRLPLGRVRPMVSDLVELANDLTEAFGEDPQRPVDPERFLG